MLTFAVRVSILFRQEKSPGGEAGAISNVNDDNHSMPEFQGYWHIAWQRLNDGVPRFGSKVASAVKRGPLASGMGRRITNTQSTWQAYCMFARRYFGTVTVNIKPIFYTEQSFFC